MSANKFVIIYQNISLVPFSKAHVPRYYEWTQIPEIQHLTRTDPSVTLQDFYQIQEEIELSNTKFTSIIHVNDADMIGDVNLFLSETEPAELDVMIGEEKFRRKGFAQKALLLFIYFANRYLGVDKFCVKILQNNTASIELFKRLGFIFVKNQPAFDEVVYEADWKSLSEEHRSVFDEISVELHNPNDLAKMIQTPAAREGILLGCCNPMLDLTATVPESLLKKYNLKENDAILAGPEHVTLPEELQSDFSVTYSPGGAGLNTMRAAQSTLPTNTVAFIGCIGSDENGKVIREKIYQEGLLENFQTCSELPTATCCVLLNGEHHRSLIANISAANHLKLDHFMTEKSQQLIQRAKYFYFTGFLLSVCPDAVLYVAKRACEDGKTFCMNLSAPFVCQFFNTQLLEILPYVDVLFGNESELVEFAAVNGWQYGELKDIVLQLSNFVLRKDAKQPRTVIITQGANSTIVSHHGEMSLYPVEKIESSLIIDTNGAGDAFCGGFLSKWIVGEPVNVCIDSGHKLAAKIIQTSVIPPLKALCPVERKCERMERVASNDWIILGIPDDSSTSQFKLLQMIPNVQVNAGKRIGKLKYETLLDLPYHSHWEIDESGKLVPFIPVNFQINLEDEDITGDNSTLIDDNSAQTVTNEEIQQLKQDQSVSREKLVDALIQGSTSFDKKTLYSQQKYAKKKALKYRKVFKVLPSNSFYLWKNAFSKMPDKILGIRQDTLSQILTIGNVACGIKALVFDGTKGLLTLSMLERMQCQSTSSDISNPNSWLTLLKGPFPSILFNSSKAKQLSSLFYNLPIDQLLLPIVEKEDFENEGAKQRYLNIKKCTQLFNQVQYDLLIIASNEINFVSYMQTLSKGLNYSRPLVIYSQYRELLIDCYVELMKSEEFINVHIHESFLREYQVLPGRVHPVMRSFASGGYILSAIKIKA